MPRPIGCAMPSAMSVADNRAGHYDRKLQTKPGEVRLKIPKLPEQIFETVGGWVRFSFTDE